ncbi:hypothetical protein [Streptomyces sp. NPDC004284]|uniref:hypothetical protein n=1 Tax=Streptomyces sp. NPDC004284 TaxID=3364695 RepID=UPI0036A93344
MSTEAARVSRRTSAGLGQITRAVKRKLKMLQYRPQVIDGCFAETGLRFGEAPLAAT